MADPAAAHDDSAELPAELLEGLDGRAREARRRLVRALRDQGVEDAELIEAARENRLALLPADRLIGGPARYTVAEMAEECGLEPDFLNALRRAQGLPLPESSARGYTEAEMELARLAARFRDAGISPDNMLQITRILGRGLSQAAGAMRSSTLELVVEDDVDEYELALRFAQLAEHLQPLSAQLLDHMLRLHLRDAVRSQLALAADDEGELSRARTMAVAFADLVGFTRMGEEVPADELGRIAGRLEELAVERVEGPVRLVKTIGDAVMLVSPEPRPLLETGLDLVDAAERADGELPQLRVGMALGPALERAGDWYGRPVNLASRITDIARPASVLVSQDVRDAVGEEGLRFSWARERRLKGIREPVKLHRARRASEE